jgi:hypothetical protein
MKYLRSNTPDLPVVPTPEQLSSPEELYQYLRDLSERLTDLLDDFIMIERERSSIRDIRDKPPVVGG